MANFDVKTNDSGSARSTQSAVNTVSSDPSAIDGLEVSSINVNGKTYYSSASSSSDSSGDYIQVSKTGLIVGLVVGIVGAVLLIAGSIFGYKKLYERQRGRRLINDEHYLESPRVNYEMNTNNLTRRLSSSTPDLANLNNNRVHSPLFNASSEQRLPSAPMSMTTLDKLKPVNQPHPTTSMPTVQLIKFD